MATPAPAIRHSMDPPIRHEWLNQWQEEIIEPDLPIVDPHHHLWERPGNRYLLRDLIADTSSGHNIVATVFVECRAMYRARGPQEMMVPGNHEFDFGKPVFLERMEEARFPLYAANLRDAFALKDGRKITGNHVTVVDDVWTTGATMQAMARVLKQAKPASLSAIVVATADPRGLERVKRDEVELDI